MKSAIAKEHKDFVEKEGWIEFQDFLSSTQLSQFNAAVDLALQKRLSIPSAKATADQLFSVGRDLWRESESLKKLVCQPRFAEIVYAFVQKKPIRLGYDQFFPATASSPFQINQSYLQYLEKATNLAEMSCVKEVIGGVLLCLGPENDVQTTFRQGSLICFLPEAALHLSRLVDHPTQRYYLIVYTQWQANYILEPLDPHTHDLKNLGYVFNDKLKDDLHPIIYR